MTRKEIKKELREMMDAETRILIILASEEGSEKDQDYMCSKLFEIVEYIVSLKQFLERMKGDET
jgi:hypothetical protein|tara:strand:- start:130 stop:321 length:192 start_codon:yes stop_codon:yes gene_type:complete